MKKLFSIVVVLLAFMCAGCIGPMTEVNKTVDGYVESLSSYVSSYGLNGESSICGDYQVNTIGRLVIVKINTSASLDDYRKLEKHFSRRYKNDSRVRNVYINKGGTLVVDCRN